MFFYIKDDNIIYQAKERLSQTPFSYDNIIENNLFPDKTFFIYEDWKIKDFYLSRYYKKQFRLDIIEDENKDLKKTVAKQNSIVKNIVGSYKTIVAERDLLLSQQQKND